jgi:hypothetical protein
MIDGSARDAGASPTTQLRAGLVLGKMSTGKFRDYAASSTDGSQIACAVLMQSIRITDFDAANQDRFYGLLVGGPVQGSKLYGLDDLARQQMLLRFFFDDMIGTPDSVITGEQFLTEVAKTADYVVTVADSGTEFTNTGAVAPVNFTLPTLATGLKYKFRVYADQTLTVTAAVAGTVIAPNDITADSVAFATGGDKIGGVFLVRSNQAATKWIVEKPCSNAMTIV